MLAVPYTLGNQIRPLAFHRSILETSRADLYFTDRRHLRRPYQAAVSEVRKQGCRGVGIDSSAQGFHYPLFALLNFGGETTAIRYVGVENPSSVYQDAEVPFTPCAIICAECGDSGERWRRHLTAGSRVDRFGKTVVLSTD
jgi:hypothetical protein